MPGWAVAIETVATAGSVALVSPKGSVNEITLPAESRSARTLAPALRKLWHDAGRPPVEMVAVAHGPGSFTGLRVGVITAKALAYGWRAPLVGVNTLDAIAAQIPCEQPQGQLHVILEAQRQELFFAKFKPLETEAEKRRWERIAADEIIGVSTWLESLAADKSITVAGPALKKLREKIPSGVTVAGEANWHPLAATICHCAQERPAAANELWTLLPHYLRASYAEEKRSSP